MTSEPFTMNTTAESMKYLMGVILVSTCFSSITLAQEKFEPGKIDFAKVYMEEAQEHYLAGRYNEAAITFMKAYSVVPLSAFLFNTGVSYEKIKMYKHAAEFFERYLDAESDAPDKEKILQRIEDLTEKAETEGITEPPVPELPPVVIIEKIECGKEGQPPCEGEEHSQKFESAASEMKSLVNVRTTPSEAKVAISTYPDILVIESTSPMAKTIEQGKYQITVEHPKYKTVETMVDVKGGRIYVVVVEMSQGSFLGYLNVRTSKPGAIVFLNEKEAGSVGKTPLGLPIPVGKHHLWIELAGFKPVEKEIEVPLGEETTVKIDLERVDFGILSVKTNVDKSEVVVDKNKKDKKPAPIEAQLSPGIHHVQVKSKGMKPVNQKVQIEKGMQTSLLVRLNPKPKKTPAWVSFALTAAFITTGAVLAHYADKIHDDVKKDAKLGYLENSDGRINKGLAFSIGADASFVLGGIMGVLGIYYIVRDKLPDSETKVKGPEDLADIEGGSE